VQADLARNSQFLSGDGNQQVGANSDPDLRFHGIGRGAIEGLDLQVLFDPLEKQLDLPALPVDLGNGGGGQCQVAGEKSKALVAAQVDKGDAS